MAAFDGILDSVSVFTGDSGGWQIEGLSATRPGRAVLEARLALAAAAQHASAPALVIERLPARDWLAENQAALPPIAVGRYFIHGRYCESPRPAGRIGLLIDAATAFGTGEHATTRGCLLALDRLAQCRGRRRRILDMGTGTGILAIAAAKTWRGPVEARDIDAEAVRVARLNARRNGVAPFVKARRSVGYRDRALHRAPFDLVFANILARPLIVMARDLRSALGDGGIAVLSGLLARQERAVLAAHRMLRLYLLRRIVVDGWSTLVLARGRRADPPPAELPMSERP
jgi:ribosomal protein L11 methyltransferase